MKRQRFVLHTAAFSIAFLMFSASAWADLTGTVYRVAGNLQFATFAPAQNVIGTAATLDVPTLSDVQFDTNPPQPGGDPYALGTLGDFLQRGVPPDTVTPDPVNGTGAAPGNWLKDVSSGSDNGSGNSCVGQTLTIQGPDGCYSTVIELSGTVTLTAGTTYSFQHDDGVVLSVGAGSTTNLLTPGSGQPTSETGASFTWGGATGTYTVNIGYMATNGNPEVLQESETPGVPEPSAVSMLIAMLVGVAGFAGILKKKLA